MRSPLRPVSLPRRDRRTLRATFAAGTLAIGFAAPATAQGILERISVSSSGVQGDAMSYAPAISADGRWVAFTSTATNLVPGVTNGTPQVYLRDRVGGTTVLVSSAAAGGPGNGQSDGACISDDGRYVAFQSSAYDLGPVDVNGFIDVYLYDRVTNTKRLASNGFFTGGATDNAWCPAISPDGRWVAFYCRADNMIDPLVDTNHASDTFVFDALTSTIRIVSLNAAGGPSNAGCGFGVMPQAGEIAITSNPLGDCIVVYRSEGSDVVAIPNPLQAPALYRRDMRTGTNELVSVDVSGNVAIRVAPIGPVYADFHGVSISADGNVVAFDTNADSLVANDTDGKRDTFVRDFATGTTRIVSVSSQQAPGTPPGFGNFPVASPPSISADGNLVAFETTQLLLVPEDQSPPNSIFVRDVANARTRLADVAPTGAPTTVACTGPSLSADGRTIAFSSGSPNLVASDTNAVHDIFVSTYENAVHGYCFGDGVDAGTTACPCANGAAERGCASSIQAGGGLVRMIGTLSLSNDAAVLAGSHMPNSSALYFQGTAVLAPATVGLAFGDGVRCVGGTLARLGTKVNANGASHFPAPGDASISALGMIAVPGTRYYQCWYRNAAAFCTADTFNLTNAVEATWGP